MRAQTTFAAIAFALPFTAAASAQERFLPSWSQVTSGVPGARHSHGMVYDRARDQIVVFGGRSGQAALDGTWLFDGATWLWGGPAHRPSARFDPAMAYDSARQRVVLFGGSGSSYLGDTWEWDGTDWTQMFPPQSPSPRRLHAMTYDETRGETVMFGGSLGAPGTWTWNGTTWTQRNVSDPGSREGASLVYSPNSHRVLLFGGNLGGQLQNDMWQWDGSSWTQLTQTVSPSPRTYYAMAYDRHLGGILLFGGFTADTWFWNDSWQQLSQTGAQPQSRAQARMAYMESRRATFLFGGTTNTYPTTTPLSDTWRTAYVATQTSFGSGCGNPALQLQPAATGARIGGTYSPRVVGIPGNPGLAFLGVGLSPNEYAGGPLPLTLTSLGMPGCTLYQDLALGLTFPTQPLTAGTAVAALPIPALIDLKGFVVFAQAWALAPASNAAGVIVSNALRVHIGD